MALYAIGDIQGCLEPLEALFAKIAFDASQDTVWFTGDLVNRGPASVETLRFVRDLGDSAITVLGNHDLHLLAVAAGHAEARGKDTIQQVLDAPDADELLTWVRDLPLIHEDAERGLLMCHAGIHPLWSVNEAKGLAQEVEAALRGNDSKRFLGAMYGNKPATWDPQLTGQDRLRFITNVLTRMRYLKKDGRLQLKFKGAPADSPAHLAPWFETPPRESRHHRIVFGHWSTLGAYDGDGVICLDSGCLWGGCLTAVRLDAESHEFFSVECA